MGPKTEHADRIHQEKYRQRGETFYDAVCRMSAAASEDDTHRHYLKEVLGEQRFLPGGRIQAGLGSTKNVTLSSCFVSGTIPDSMEGIMDRAKEAALTMKMGGGIGYDFSTLRGRGAKIKSLDSFSSGPISFMDIFNSVCSTVASAGNRRGAQMGTLRVDHPSVEEFIYAKRNKDKLNQFNISVAVTDDFMRAVSRGEKWPLIFDGEIYKEVDARTLWDEVMRSNWDWSEPGVIFIDQMNRMNNLWYAEEIASTNPSMPAGTLVHTDKGILPIDKLENNNFKVRVLDGTWAKADCFLSSECADVYEINLGSNRTIRATAEHKWPVLLNGRYIKVTTSELVEGDLIPMNVNDHLNINVRDDLTYEDGLFSGILLGDGWFGIRKDTNSSYLGISFNKEERELAEFCAAYAGVNITERESEINIQKTDQDWVTNFFEKVGMNIEDRRQLPSVVWCSNNQFVAGFIDGIFSADGCVTLPTKLLVLTSCDREFLHTISKLLSFHGVASTVYGKEFKKPKFPNGKIYDRKYERYDLKISINQIRKFSKLFSLSCVRKNDKLLKLAEMPYRNCLSENNITVKSITFVSKERVWDIRVQHPQHVFPTEWVTTGNCSEQPLGPYANCLLGSFNLIKYVTEGKFDFTLFHEDIRAVLRMMDIVIDRNVYPLEEQRIIGEAQRRLGIGVTALANALELMGLPYGSPKFLEMEAIILSSLRNRLYTESTLLAKEKGTFPCYYKESYLQGGFIRTLPSSILDLISRYGIRNSHLVSVAPTGTISLAADNISSGIEPVFSHRIKRTILKVDGAEQVELEDYNVREHNLFGKTSDEVTLAEHIDVLLTAQSYTDSAVSKTINFSGKTCSWEDFKSVYEIVWKRGGKSCSTHNNYGKRTGILEGAACFIDPESGLKECS